MEDPQGANMFSLSFTVNLDVTATEAIGPANTMTSILSPDMYQESADIGIAAKANRKNYRSTWLPGLTAAENLALKDGGTLTAYGERAIYLRDTYATGWTPAAGQSLPPSDRRFLVIA